ncbi:serine protease inhibitor 28Dc [Contarinia nasturtii]|uniref:serine protease inhibitor 28Dc n=1 Tax=Contarinia nasturtii TaxID=265458 RepID=UPI0012D40171|nr:serine protease inhibitor 28Dc [Contarinia nasturtii]XP_031617155.1 serine protease inhibitor 28Dc [Contarinia nasturtii]XP_031617156.1 serine protease inhibitor 28Dc [Contarinia nasturtii]XP_031617157.1 serine protease inhibitor 28Dc [Contarinia nasturtii]XP_031617158.1 serine protease inhibitor 28Dc [Contarinia nasturtii]
MKTLKTIGVSFLVLAPILIVFANDDESSTDPRFDARVSELLASNMLKLSQEIGTTVLQDSDKTEIFSPLCIYSALSTLLMGANGQTFQELMNVLKINNDPYLSQNTWKVHEEFSLMIDDLNRDIPHPGRRRRPVFWTQNHQQNRDENKNQNQSYQQIQIANGIFFQNGYFIRDDYRSAIESVYKSTLQRLDFANKPELSSKYINSWVKEKTQNKIKEIISDPLSSTTKSVIASALYFKAVWERMFLEGLTKPKEFYPYGIGRAPIFVEMMATGGSYPFYDSQEFDCRIIGLPYRKHLTTMYIILPNNSTRQRLRHFQATLTADKIESMISKMEMKTAIILFPKLHITNRIDLKKILNRMGLRSLFNYDQSDLSLISTGIETIPYQESPFIFNRFAETESKHMTNETATVQSVTKRERRSAATFKTINSDFHTDREPLRLKDVVIKKRITKSYLQKKLIGRNRREVENISDQQMSLKRLDLLRTRLSSEHYPNPRLYADELIHQIDLTVNEVGTEGGAATVTTLRRSGPDVFFRAETPFLFLIRHEDTKIPIFYGAVFEPRNE